MPSSDKSDSEVRKQTFYRNINHDNEEKYIAYYFSHLSRLGGLDFAFKVHDYSNVDIYDPSYFNLQVNQISTKWVLNEDGETRSFSKYETLSVPYEKCGDSLFNFADKEAVFYHGIDSYFCPREKDFSVYGAFYGDYFRYVQIRLMKCVNGTQPGVVCKEEAEIDRLILESEATLSLVFVNSFFDSTDFESPLKAFIDD